MPGRCLLYYITDRTGFPGDESVRRRHLLEKIAEAARCGVGYIQLREKDLTARELEQLAREALRVIQDNSKPRMDIRSLATNHWPLTTALLINSRTDIALAAGAEGVHLRSVDVAPTEVRAMWRGAASTEGVAAPVRESALRKPIVAVSCHSEGEVVQAASSGANFAVFAPIFEKHVGITRPTGLAALHQVCHAKIPVLALGGVTLENAQSCLEAGAAGLAAIRLFQESDIARIVQKLS